MSPGVKRTGRGGLPYPEPTTGRISAAMRGNRRTDTRPELRLRSELHRRGLRFRKNVSVDLGGARAQVDVVFPKEALAVFVDGCYWHGCPTHGKRPQGNSRYWAWKIEKNRLRDQRVTVTLEGRGWTVMRFWEHTPPEEAADEVVAQRTTLRRGVSPSRSNRAHRDT